MGQRGKSNKRLRLLRKDWLAEQTATSEIVNGWDSADVPLGILIERSKLYKIVQRDVSGPWWEKLKGDKFQLLHPGSNRRPCG